MMNNGDDFDIDFEDIKSDNVKDDNAKVESDKKEARKSELNLSSQKDKKKANARLLVIRHGNTFEKGEIPRRIGARTDLPLTLEGRKQLARLKKHFEDFNMMPKRVYAGPLKRTLQSAQELTKSYEIIEFLREIYHGLDENKTDAEVVKRIGKQALIRWEMENALPPGWTADLLYIRQGWNGLKKLCLDNGGTWAAVTSGGIARFVFDDVDNVPKIRKLATGAYGILSYDIEKERWVCEGWNLKP